MYLSMSEKSNPCPFISTNVIKFCVPTEPFLTIDNILSRNMFLITSLPLNSSLNSSTSFFEISGLIKLSSKS
jgi:hypothetical protein